MEVPESFVIQHFYLYSGYPEYISTSGVYNACCPICREGKSWGKKKRLFYIPSDNRLFCHNCNRGWSPLSWIMEVSGKSYFEVMLEIDESDHTSFKLPEGKKEVKKNPNTLPVHSINLFNKQETDYYRNNKIVKDALDFIQRRRLNTAKNRVDLYLSLKDFIYKNRVCIPFKEMNNKIIFHQCRALYESDEKNYGKYISKLNADKSVFNVEKIDLDFPYIFLFEGPINSMFVKNGVAVAGLSYTELQKTQLRRFITHKKIWVLDNQRVDKAAKEKSFDLVKRKETIFVWPKQLENHKDLNDLCIANKIDEVPPEIFIKKCVDSQTMLNLALL